MNRCRRSTKRKLIRFLVMFKYISSTECSLIFPLILFFPYRWKQFFADFHDWHFRLIFPLNAVELHRKTRSKGQTNKSSETAAVSSKLPRNWRPASCYSKWLDRYPVFRRKFQCTSLFPGKPKGEAAWLNNWYSEM